MFASIRQLPTTFDRKWGNASAATSSLFVKPVPPALEPLWQYVHAHDDAQISATGVMRRAGTRRPVGKEVAGFPCRTVRGELEQLTICLQDLARSKLAAAGKSRTGVRAACEVNSQQLS